MGRDFRSRFQLKDKNDTRPPLLQCFYPEIGRHIDIQFDVGLCFHGAPVPVRRAQFVVARCAVSDDD